MNQEFSNIYMTILLLCNDALFYGYFYERRGWFKKWLFREWEQPFGRNETWVPFYRLFIQWPLDILALYIVYNPHWNNLFWEAFRVNIPFIGMLLAWYGMVKEGGYYIVLGQWKGLKLSELFQSETPLLKWHTENTHWLKRWYFSGKFIFVTVLRNIISEDRKIIELTDYGFRRKAFGYSCVAALIILIISNFIYVGGK